MNNDVLYTLKDSLVVSCQAMETEPLFGSNIMARMAFAAYQGGAAGIRANGADDIMAISQQVPLPIIGLKKQVYPGSRVYITPTGKEVSELVATSAWMIALDGTDQKRPKESLRELIGEIHRHGKLVLADVATLHQAVQAVSFGADAVSTALAGYETREMRKILEMNSLDDMDPDFALISALVRELPVPVFAEGHIASSEDAGRCLDAGAYCVVVGAAITRPQLITARFVQAIRSKKGKSVCDVGI
jgi:N-acylglucosamine-6-phosphate 2-epimerase